MVIMLHTVSGRRKRGGDLPPDQDAATQASTEENSLGVESGKNGDFEGAISHFQRASELDSNNDESWGNLGVSLMRKAAAMPSAEDVGTKAVRDVLLRESKAALDKAVALSDGSAASISNLRDLARTVKALGLDIGRFRVPKKKKQGSGACSDAQVRKTPSWPRSWAIFRLL